MRENTPSLQSIEQNSSEVFSSSDEIDSWCSPPTKRERQTLDFARMQCATYAAVSPVQSAYKVRAPESVHHISCFEGIDDAEFKPTRATMRTLPVIALPLAVSAPVCTNAETPSLHLTSCRVSEGEHLSWKPSSVASEAGYSFARLLAHEEAKNDKFVADEDTEMAQEETAVSHEQELIEMEQRLDDFFENEDVYVAPISDCTSALHATSANRLMSHKSRVGPTGEARKTVANATEGALNLSLGASRLFLARRGLKAAPKLSLNCV